MKTSLINKRRGRLLGALPALVGSLLLAVASNAWAQRGPAVGKPALEIEGKDVDDKTLKLSDYKGKVVLLDFWGDW